MCTCARQADSGESDRLLHHPFDRSEVMDHAEQSIYDLLRVGGALLRHLLLHTNRQPSRHRPDRNHGGPSHEDQREPLGWTTIRARDQRWFPGWDGDNHPAKHINKIGGLMRVGGEAGASIINEELRVLI